MEMATNGVALNLITALCVGLGVNWLADWLPYYGSASAANAIRSWRRWGWVMLAVLLGGSYLSIQAQSSDAFSGRGWLFWCFFALFLLILVIDLEHRRVLNVVVYPMAVVGLLLALLHPQLSFVNALVGGLVGFGLFLLLYLARPGGLGAGDVKLAGLIGILVGFPGIVVAILVAIGLGGVAAAALLLSRRVGPKGTMAYAPYLSIGALFALMYGPAIIAWYFGRFGIL